MFTFEDVKFPNVPLGIFNVPVNAGGLEATATRG
jgi:hypothetical protein